jgi:hypothetical protein
VGGCDTSGFAWGVAVSGNYAYVVWWDGLTHSGIIDGGAFRMWRPPAVSLSALEIIDISNPANPQRVGGYDTSGSAYGVAVSSNYAYVATSDAGLQVIDVSDPTQPRRVGGNRAFNAFDVIVAGNKVFVTAGEQGLMILDLFRAPLRLEPVSPQQPGALRFLLHGEAGLTVRVQRSSNMRDWEAWQSVTLGAVPAELTDADAGAIPRRFYRAVYP